MRQLHLRLLTQLLVFGILTPSLILQFPDAAIAQRKKTEFAWPAMRYQGTWLELSDELRQSTPFDTDALYAIKDRDNREQLYLRTFFMIAHHSVGPSDPNHWFAEPIGAQQFLKNSSLERKRKKTAQNFKKIDQFIRKSKRWSTRRNRYEIDDRYKVRLIRVIRDLEWIYDDLETAQEQRKACFFLQDFASPFTSPQHLNPDLHSLTQVIYAVEPLEGLSYLRLCKIHLALARDLAPLRNVNIESTEIFALNNLLQAGLSQPQDEADVDGCIEFLKQHLAETNETDELVEEAKHMFIRSVAALIALRDKNYAYGNVDIRGRTLDSLISALIRKAFGDTSSHPRDIAERMEELLKPEYTKLAQFTDEQKRFLEETLQRTANAKQNLSMGSDTDRTFVAIVDKMSRADFAREIEVQQHRYRDIVAACEKPAAERAEDIEKLNVVWSFNPVWTKSPILAFSGTSRLTDNEIKMRFYRRAGLCIAVVKKWRMNHDGKAPTTLEEAFEFADAGAVPLDPYTDKPLKMSNSKVETIISSPGPGNSKKDLEYAVEFER
ncbi:hypothetical protein [Mariniblastus fucicola]|uniref:Uncharacterized protein n=1 Tax=Mariniblastus fucicola TaxID=980251 RepID=A0A5B9PCQ7_9BACT|nr:hypothetical protein [Mariniblastus fucicola]QEG20881.1 hypothetical protein MFFC18_07320 [Mariniblastus fucicola]